MDFESFPWVGTLRDTYPTMQRMYHEWSDERAQRFAKKQKVEIRESHLRRIEGLIKDGKSNQEILAYQDGIVTMADHYTNDVLELVRNGRAERAPSDYAVFGPNGPLPPLYDIAIKKWHLDALKTCIRWYFGDVDPDQYREVYGLLGLLVRIEPKLSDNDRRDVFLTELDLHAQSLVGLFGKFGVVLPR